LTKSVLLSRLQRSGDRIEAIQGQDLINHHLSRAGILSGFPSEPVDLAGIAAFLASKDCDYITGQVIISDGGMVLV
jgi:NAD(P)-dependent dehydrogenase (short-subunit alcohol dehydrogenase family)